MSERATVTEVVRNFADYINRVAYRGERFLLERGGRVVAELRPVPEGRRLGDLPEILASLPRLSPDEAEAFACDLEEVRDGLNALPAGDPWDT